MTATDEATRTDAPPRIAYLVKHVESFVRRGLDERKTDKGITTMQYTSLSLVARYPDQSSAQLARRTFVTPQSAQTMVQALERRGLVERTPDPENQRILRIRLTDRGHEVMAIADRTVDEMEAQMLTGVDPQTVEVLRAALQHVARNLRAGSGGR
jgi:DNA-binding MarR family transcriptional regulator